MTRSPFCTASIRAAVALVTFLPLLFGPAAADAQAPEIDFGVTQHELSNGLRVVLLPDRSAPTVAVAVYYDVGSRNEVPGRSGFAHLFEHMMFQGSENIPKGGHFQHVNRNGGRMNGTTSEDRTNYFEVLPSDRLALGLWLEADRMRALDISAENFENQREVVKEERRLRVDNAPYIPAWLEFYAFAYESWEYSHSVIGSMDDLDAAELADVQAFFDLWYAPNNAVLALAGDFDPDEAMELVALYFGGIPRGETPPPVSIEEPPQTEYRERSTLDAHATQPAAIIGWHVPGGDHPDHYPLELLANVLSGGESSRLYDRLITTDELAQSVDADLENNRGAGLFTLWTVSRGSTPEELRDPIFDEIRTLVDGGITTEELEAAREQVYRQLVSRVESNLGRALTIATDSLYFDQPSRINDQAARYESVTVEDVNRVAREYLLETNCDVMLITPEHPEEQEGDEPEAAQ